MRRPWGEKAERSGSGRGRRAEAEHARLSDEDMRLWLKVMMRLKWKVMVSARRVSTI